jgi:3-oxoacyl-[acyl-carrier protein] reductase
LKRLAKSWGNFLLQLKLNGRVAIVTGATRGIGLAIATALAQQGVSLVINGKSNLSSLENVALELSKNYDVEVATVLGDVALQATAQDLAKVAFRKFKQLDILVNNAGILRDSAIGMTKEEDIAATIGTNLTSVIHSTQAAARLMQRNKRGSIINLSSIIGRVGNRGQFVYGASKAGVIGATLSAAKELAPSGIRVNAIAPGYIETDMIKNIRPEIHAERLKSIAMARIGTPEDIADVVLFLASDLSRYVTGQVIGVDGGMVI